ncbi:hypothetical protein IJ579_08335 [bacterium]|nr:hypothetical protein [bacterium]
MSDGMKIDGVSLDLNKRMKKMQAMALGANFQPLLGNVLNGSVKVSDGGTNLNTGSTHSRVK